MSFKDDEKVTETFEESQESTGTLKLQEQNLSEKETLMISILRGNEMQKTEIAAAMGLSMNTTTRMLKKLQEGGFVQSKGASRHVIYYAS